ncbi:hypothetical protein L0657_21950 [Dyadobacter sp. CY345]|uniref:hypothetical protein n=1 Tax=Dyadobacter sp. CY345 TaxID=2909335 RepID=UPI001F357778|nr:hypothetical protein [Dyadobacter sp. CY345]MCF2446636.1 hypothetical protein [Dyadobacter sp. CY345]
MKKVLILCLFWVFVSCVPKGKYEKNMKIEEAIKNADSWLDFPGVVGVAQSREKGHDVILVMISANSDSIKNKIPETFHNFTVIVKEVGEINAQ